MTRMARINRGICEVEDRTRTSRFCKRNPEREKLDRDMNEANKKSIDGYVRIFRDGRKKMFIRPEHP